MSPRIRMVIARDPPLATLYELSSVYNLRDLYDLLEIASVDAYNQRVFDEHYRKKAQADRP